MMQVRDDRKVKHIKWIDVRENDYIKSALCVDRLAQVRCAALASKQIDLVRAALSRGEDEEVIHSLLLNLRDMIDRIDLACGYERE